MSDTSKNIFKKIVRRIGMVLTTKEIGDFGEDAAEKYLKDNDYEVLKRNFRLKFGEIDIIAKQNDCIVFVEVKTRKSSDFGQPSEYVNLRKQIRIKKAAAVYIDIENNDIRFDVIEVFYSERGGKTVLNSINHIENAF